MTKTGRNSSRRLSCRQSQPLDLLRCCAENLPGNGDAMPKEPLHPSEWIWFVRSDVAELEANIKQFEDHLTPQLREAMLEKIGNIESLLKALRGDLAEYPLAAPAA